MKDYINIKLYILLAGLFLLFNLSCEDDDYPTSTDEEFTYEISWTAAVTNNNGDDLSINYADNNSVEWQTITISLLEIDSEGNSQGKANASIRFFIDTNENTDATLNGLTDNKANTDANGQLTLTWNDSNYVGPVEIDFEYTTSDDTSITPENPITFTVYSVYEKVENLQVTDDLVFELPVENNEQVLEVRVTDSTSLNGVGGIDVQIEFDALTYSYLSVPNGTTAQTDDQGYATFTIRLTENSILDDAISLNDNSINIPMTVKIENSNLNCTNCNNNTLTTSFNTEINQTSTPTDNAYATIDNVYVTVNPSILVLNPEEDDQALNVNAYVYENDGNSNIAVPGVFVKFLSDDIIIPSSNVISTNDEGLAQLSITNFDTIEEGEVVDIQIDVIVVNQDGSEYTNSQNETFSDSIDAQVGYQLGFNILDVNQVILTVSGSSSLVLSDTSSGDSDENSDGGDGDGNGDNDGESGDDSSATEEDNNSFTLNAVVLNQNNNAVIGIPVIFEVENGFGSLLEEVLTDGDGMATNILQNITTPNSSVLETFDVIAKVIDPTDNVTILASESITLQVGNQLAYNFPNFNLITMQIEPSLLIFNDIPSDTSTDSEDGEDGGEEENTDETSNNTVTITASVRNNTGGPLSDIPVVFSNSGTYTFTASPVNSIEDGTATTQLQNINIPTTPGMESITITGSVMDPSDNSMHAFDEEILEIAYQSIININNVYDLTTARVQSLQNENNINIEYADTIKAWVNNVNGGGVENVPIQFSLQPNSDNEIVGLISNDVVWTNQNGYAYVVFSLTEANLIDYAGEDLIPASVQISVTDELAEIETWDYFIEGSPNIEDDVFAFHFYSSDLPESEHTVTIMTGDTLMLPFIAKDASGIRISDVPVRFEIYDSTNPLRAYGDLSSSYSTTCCNDSTTIFEDIDGNGIATINENMGIATTNYNNIIIEQTTIDHIRAWILDPETGIELFADTVSVTVNPPDTQVDNLFSYPIPETILMDTMDSVYCDTITAIASNSLGQSLQGVNVYFSLEQDDQQYGYISDYFTVTDSIPNTGYFGSRTTFCTYPNISFENQTHTINIDVQTPFTTPVLENEVEIFLVEDLPDCPDCEASLSLISEYYELPAGDNDIFTTLVTATVIDSTENPVPENTLVQFQSLTENEDGDLVPIGSIEPYKFTDDQGIASATFNMETDVGLAQIIATAPTFNLADTMYINITSTDATSMELVNPFPNEIMVQGGGGVEASELTMLIKDGSGNLVTEPFLVHFEILPSAPLGVYLNEHDENDFIECAESSNGEATVTLNSGTQPGSVPIRAELYPLDIGIDCNSINSGTFTSSGIASLESVPVTVVTGPPEFGQINYSYVDISPIGGGLYEVPLSVNLWDFYSNPVADSTNVYIWIEGIAPPWSIDSLYTFGDTVKWGDLDPLGNVIEVDSLLYVWNNELFDDDDLNSPLPGDGFELTGSLLWLPIPHPGAVVGEAKTGMEAPDGQSYPGVAWSTVNYGTSNMFDNTVIKALTYNSEGEKLIIDGRDSHNGEGLVLPFQPGILSIAASVQFWNFSVFGDAGLNDLDDTVAVDIQSNLTDYYQYPVDNGTILINAPGANIWAVCDPADTDNDGFVGCCDSFDVIGGTGTGNGDGICDVQSDFNTCSECVSGGGTWIPDAAQDDPNIFGTQINGPNDVADDPAYGKTNGDGQVLWNISYSEALNPGDAQNPETYEDFTSTVTTQLLDPIQTASDGVDILLIKSEVNENP